jgi:hypothetical protein
VRFGLFLDVLLLLCQEFTVLYRVLFHNFGQFLAEHERRPGAGHLRALDEHFRIGPGQLVAPPPHKGRGVWGRA